MSLAVLRWWRAGALAALALSGAAQAMPGCREFAQRFPQLSQAACEQARLEPGTGRSVHGVPLYSRDIPQPGARLRVLVVGMVHGDELTAATLAFHWIGLAAAQVPPHQPVHWRFIPVLNPDGALARPPRRTNANGVDLNRNFPTVGWQEQAPRYWEQRTRKDPRRWPGPSPLSEPESRFLLAQIEAFQPQLIVAIHAPYGVLDFDGPSVPPTRLGRLVLDQVGIFPGSLGNWGGVERGVPVVTIELGHAVRAPSPAEMGQMWQDLHRWMAERLPVAAR